MQTDSTIVVQPFYIEQAPYWTREEVEVNTGVPLDSIFPIHEVTPPVVRRSLFTGHTMAVENNLLVPREQTSAAPWLFILIMILGALTYLYVNSRKIKFVELLRSTVDHRVLERIIRVNNLTPMRMVTIGLLLACISSVSISQLALYEMGFKGWLLTAAGITVAYLMRWGLLRLLGRVFEEEEGMSMYISNCYMYHLLLTIVLLPLTMLLIYMPWGTTAMMVTIGIMVALCFIMRLFRGVKLFLTISTTHSFYLFYYLCTVELVPIALLIAWLFAQ